MEESRPLPVPEETAPTEETRPTHLATLLTRFNKQPETGALPPEAPPPILLEQLGYEQAATAAAPEADVSVEVEEIPDPESESLAARQRLEEAYQAAEQNLPEEAKNERRAELKPEPDPVQETQRTAAAVGNVLAELHQKTAAAFAAFGRVAPSPSSLPLPAAFAALPALYQKAILLGFGGAFLAIGMMIVLTAA